MRANNDSFGKPNKIIYHNDLPPKIGPVVMLEFY
jgi:hypothetical protein